MTPAGLDMCVGPFCINTRVLGIGLQKLEVFQETTARRRAGPKTQQAAFYTLCYSVAIVDLNIQVILYY